VELSLLLFSQFAPLLSGPILGEVYQALQADFDQWLIEYNTERPHQGYRNLGKRPIETILSYLESVRQEG